VYAEKNRQGRGDPYKVQVLLGLQEFLSSKQFLGFDEKLDFVVKGFNSLKQK
jgi:hypothetical protein